MIQFDVIMVWFDLMNEYNLKPMYPINHELLMVFKYTIGYWVGPL